MVKINLTIGKIALRKTYLKKRKYKLIYSGTDIVPAMKKLAINKFPELEYHIRDIIQDRVEETYDYVVLSGTFNLPGDINHKEWKDFTRSMIISMFKIANKGIAFNFLSQNDSSFFQFQDFLGRKVLLMWLTPNSAKAWNILENKNGEITARV